jgi:hypothetical protein
VLKKTKDRDGKAKPRKYHYNYQIFWKNFSKLVGSTNTNSISAETN